MKQSIVVLNKKHKDSKMRGEHIWFFSSPLECAKYVSTNAKDNDIRIICVDIKDSTDGMPLYVVGDAFFDTHESLFSKSKKEALVSPNVPLNRVTNLYTMPKDEYINLIAHRIELEEDVTDKGEWIIVIPFDTNDSCENLLDRLI